MGFEVEFVGGLVRLKNPPVLDTDDVDNNGCDCGTGSDSSLGKVDVALDAAELLFSLALACMTGSSLFVLLFHSNFTLLGFFIISFSFSTVLATRGIFVDE